MVWLNNAFDQHDVKRNRESIEGYAKSVARKNNDKFGNRIGLNK